MDAVGVTPHTHDRPESVAVLEGEAVTEIDGVPHRLVDAPDTAPMRILWTYASLDATRTSESTGVTAGVDAEHGRG